MYIDKHCIVYFSVKNWNIKICGISNVRSLTNCHIPPCSCSFYILLLLSLCDPVTLYDIIILALLSSGQAITISWTSTQYVHYNDVIMSTMASQITSLTIVYWTGYSGVDQRKHQGSASLAFVRGIHRWPVNSPHKGPVTRKMFPFDDVIMLSVEFIGTNFGCEQIYDILTHLPIMPHICVGEMGQHWFR